MTLHDTSYRYRRLTICQSLRNGNGDGETDYVEQFGMTIGTEPLTNPMRLITPPTMRYGDNSKERTVVSFLLLVSSFAYLDPMSSESSSWIWLVEHVSALPCMSHGCELNCRNKIGWTRSFIAQQPSNAGWSWFTIADSQRTIRSE